MYIDDELRKHAAAISRRDSHYSGQRTVLSYSTSRSRRRSSSIDNGNYSYYNTPSARNSRPDSIRQLDSENFTLTDEYSFIDGNNNNNARRSRTRSISSIYYRYNNVSHNTRRPSTSGRMTIAPPLEDEKVVSNFSRKGSVASAASRKSGKNHGHNVKSNYNFPARHDKSYIQASIPNLPGTGHFTCEKAANDGGGGGGGGGGDNGGVNRAETSASNGGNKVEAFAGHWPGAHGNGAKTSDFAPGPAGQRSLYREWPPDLLLDDSTISRNDVSTQEQSRESQTKVLPDGVSPAIQLNDWSQISSSAPTSSSRKEHGRDYLSEKRHAELPVHSMLGNAPSQRSLGRWRLVDKLSELGYLVIFSMLGTLARIGLARLTFYPGAPVSSSVVWANLTGCFLLGFLAFEIKSSTPGSLSVRYRRATSSAQRYDSGRGEMKSNKAEIATKASNPLYVGLAVGFCGSLTSFSALMHDAFLAISNDLPGLGFGREIFDRNDEIRAALPGTLSRSPVLSILSVLATLIVNAALSIGAFTVGKHFAGGLALRLPALRQILPGSRNAANRRGIMTFKLLVIFVSITIWSAIIAFAALSEVIDISSVTRTTFLFPLAFAPAGCLLRFALSLLNRPHQQQNRRYGDIGSSGNLIALHPPQIYHRSLWQRISSSPYIFAIPLGTLTANLLGTLIFSLTWDFQHGLGLDSLSSASAPGSNSSPLLSPLSCQVLTGVQDGFCGALTTVSTLVMEIVSIAGIVRVRKQTRRQTSKSRSVGPEERWWVALRQQRLKQQNERERARKQQGSRTRKIMRPSLGSASMLTLATPNPTDGDRDLSRLELRESMKPRARFIESARSDYHENDWSRGRIGGGGGYGGGHGGVVDEDDPHRGKLGYLDYNDNYDDEIYGYDYGRAYAYGVGTVLAGLVVVIVVMGSLRWTGGWDESVERMRFCFA